MQGIFSFLQYALLFQLYFARYHLLSHAIIILIINNDNRYCNYPNSILSLLITIMRGEEIKHHLIHHNTPFIKMAGANDMNHLQGVEEFILEQMEAWKVPGVAVSIVKDGQVILSEGYGFRDSEKEKQVTPETIFPIGSATKAFTTAAMGVLVDEGQLDWDQPVREYIPSFKMYDP